MHFPSVPYSICTKPAYLILYPFSLPLSVSQNQPIASVRWSDENDVTFSVTLGNHSGAWTCDYSRSPWMIHLRVSSVAVRLTQTDLSKVEDRARAGGLC